MNNKKKRFVGINSIYPWKWWESCFWGLLITSSLVLEWLWPSLSKERKERYMVPSKMVPWLPQRHVSVRKVAQERQVPWFGITWGLDYRWNGRVGRNTSVCSYISHYNINSSRHVLGTLYVLVSTITKRTIHRYIILSSFCGWKNWGSKVGD